MTSTAGLVIPCKAAIAWEPGKPLVMERVEVAVIYPNLKLEMDKFITHRVPFSDINKAFDLMGKGEGLRCIISMED